MLLHLVRGRDSCALRHGLVIERSPWEGNLRATCLADLADVPTYGCHNTMTR